MILKSDLKGREKAEALGKELTKLKEARKAFEGDWERAQQFVSATVLNFTQDPDSPDKPYILPKRITSRPANYMETLVAGVAGYSINPNILWLKLGLENAELLDQYGVKDWLEKAEGELYRAYNKGNLYAQMPGFIENAATFGHAVMLIDEQIRDRRIRTANMDIRELYLDTNEYDEVETIFREYYMTWESAAAYFGQDKLAEEIKNDWDLTRVDPGKKKIRILHAVYPNKNDKGAYAPNKFPFASVFVDLDHKHIIQEGGYNDFPYAIYFWKRLTGKKYGIGPAMMALSDINLLHKFEAARLDVAQFASRPPYNVPEQMQGTEEIVPDGRNYYANGNEVIMPIEVGANFPITLEISKEQEERIKEWFHVDFFLMLSKMNLSQMTATAVVELQGEKAAVLSTMVSNFNYALQKIIQRSVDICFRQERFPELPFALQETRTAMKVDFIGVLAQAQKRAHETSGLMQGLQIMGALANIAKAVPDVAGAFDYVNTEEIIKRGFDSAGASQLIIREDDDVEALRQARAEQQAAMMQQQQQMQAQEMLAKNYKNLNEPVNPGSPMAEMEEAMA